MRSLDNVVAKGPTSTALAVRDARDAAPRSESDSSVISGLRERAGAAREVLDAFVSGAKVGDHPADAQAACALRDLGLALADLSGRSRGKAVVRFYDDPWEMCVERIGALAALSVYRAGAEPFVAVYDRVVAFAEVIDGARDAIRAALAKDGAAASELAATLAELSAIDVRRAERDDAPETIPSPSPVTIEIDRDSPIAFGADFAIRPGAPFSSDPSVERADLHALLFRGRLRAEIRGRSVELAETHPFLFAERLLELSRRALEAFERGIAYHVRGEIGGLLLGVRLSVDGKLALTLGAQQVARRERAVYTFPALGVADVVESSMAFGRALVRGILRRDRSQCTNLRLSAFRRQLREASDALREVCRLDSKINPTPEPYRAFAESARQRGMRASDAPGPSIAQARLRYAARWRALVPGIDLRATFLCGDRLIVGGAQETFCLARATGDVLWRTPTQRATCVVTPGGVARLLPDGTLNVHDFGNGEITMRAKLTPRAFGPPAGAVVNMPGLPRLLIVTEGEQHLVAIDLTSGESRWRFTWGKSDKASQAGALRMKRAGKLLYFTCGDSALTALDVSSGAVVWRVRDRMRFRVAPTLDHDALFALAGGAGSVGQLHSIDPYSGHSRWTRSLPDPAAPCTVEGAPLAAGDVVALAVRERNGLKLVAFDRETGEPRWATPGPVAPIGTSWLAIDDLIVGNTPVADLVGVEAATGQLRYRQVLGPRALEADVPRRLEPVLRSGALFVPHTDVHVIRPRDGAPLATIAPCEAIPDLLRVDERCDVYVAEESGHLVSFTAQAKLSLVRG